MQKALVGWGKKRRDRERDRGEGVPFSTVKMVCFWKENGSRDNNGREREKKTSIKRNAPQRRTAYCALSLSLPHNWLSKNLDRKPPLNGTPRQTGLARTATRATGLKNGQQPRVRATPYWPHHGNRGGGGREGEQLLLDAARLFEDDPGSLPTATAKGPAHHSSLPSATTYSSTTKASRPSPSRQLQIPDTHESFVSNSLTSLDTTKNVA